VIHMVAENTGTLQPPVAFFFAVANKMPVMDWGKWADRLRERKRQGRHTDESIAIAMQERGFDVGRGLVNHWWHKRRPIGLEEFFAVCEILGADPGEILFEAPVLPKVVTNFEETRRSIVGAQEFSPKSAPPVVKARTFKQSKAKVRRR
jgi:hypothetical protein